MKTKIVELIEKPLIKMEIAAITTELRSLLGCGKFKDTREFFVIIDPDRIRTGNHQFIDDDVIDIAKVLLHIDFNDIFPDTRIFDFNDFSDDLLISLIRLGQNFRIISRLKAKEDRQNVLR